MKPPQFLKPDDWASGDKVRLLDIIAPSQKMAPTVLANFKHAVKSQSEVRAHFEGDEALFVLERIRMGVEWEQIDSNPIVTPTLAQTRTGSHNVSVLYLFDCASRFDYWRNGSVELRPQPFAGRFFVSPEIGAPGRAAILTG